MSQVATPQVLLQLFQQVWELLALLLLALQLLQVLLLLLLLVLRALQGQLELLPLQVAVVTTGLLVAPLAEPSLQWQQVEQQLVEQSQEVDS
eukprot:s3256_g18.t1